MATSADNLATVTTEPVYQEQSSDDSSTLCCDDEPSTAGEKRRATGRHETSTQRVRAVRITTRIYPDILIPYLYDERSGRSINAIVNTTGCTIDYCALSPDEFEQSPTSRGYVMSFLPEEVADTREAMNGTSAESGGMTWKEKQE
ncbi:unnamed protein product [Peronospora farinosa]|uniref:Uncharacterized protein n=1 Tax=Peronospora farinosa TaxID=134698 RepID=A0AAV0SQN8_9STRA|nr:unnamed protein product [Peronospora farinosa]